MAAVRRKGAKTSRRLVAATMAAAALFRQLSPANCRQSLVTTAYRIQAARRIVRPYSFDTKTAKLVLLRHGQSTWNAVPTFTGWCDAPLTQKGIDEAKAAGELLRQRGLTHFDYAFTSELQRASVTCELALQQASYCGEFIRAWELNERHYGALQGFRKNDPDLLQQYGKEQLRAWRREFAARPPPIDVTSRYAQESPPAPRTESLQDCQDRVLEYWHDTILPRLNQQNTVLLAAHSNTLRALVSFLDNVSLEQIPNIHIPNSVPCVYEFDKDSGEVVSPLLHSHAGGSRGQWLFSAENHARLRDKLGGSGSLTRAIFDAWDLNGDGVLERREIELGLKDLIGADDVAVSALAGKILQQVDQDGNDTLDLEEFETHALEACRKFFPQLMEEE